MRFHLFLPLLLLPGLGACSSEDASTPAFDDPVAAMDQADAARAAGNVGTALAGYDYALAHGDERLQGDALLATLELHLGGTDEDAALNAFERLKADFPDRLDGKRMLRLCDQARDGAKVEVGEEMLQYAVATYPELKEKLALSAAAFEKLRTEGPEADLSGIGYAGD